MELMSFVKLFGGLAIFIYGMTIMGTGLEKIAGAKLEKTLEKVAGNLWKAIFMGLLVTLIIQSSSATTVMVIGFVNAGIMTLGQSVGIILGANIGTTITSQILRLDSGAQISGSFFMQLIKPSNFAYIAVLIGVIMITVSKEKKKYDIGTIFIGFGILFIGMSTMESAVSPLRDIPQFQELFIAFTNPVLGVFVGAFVTAVLQSSSASVGILQALSTTGMITYASAVPIILGQNIGTCVTAILSSINGNKNAKRAACIHFYFNVIGTILFLIAVYSIHSFVGFSFWDDNIDKGGIANFHTIFNISTVLLFIPFNKLLVAIAEKTFPYEENTENPLSRLDKRFYQTPQLALDQCNHCIITMAEKANENFLQATQAIITGKFPKDKPFLENEKFLDTAEVEIGRYLLGISGLGSSKMRQNEMLRSLSEFEKVGDYAKDIIDSLKEMQEKEIKFNEQAKLEIKTMCNAVAQVIVLTKEAYISRDIVTAKQVEPLEDVVDILKETLKINHLQRLDENICSIDSGHYFLDIVSDLEKIADHCSNIAICIIQQESGDEGFNTHSYIKSRDKTEIHYIQAFEKFESKYLDEVRTKKA